MTRVAVVGDLLLDTDVVGRVDRVCPDAPAPVLAEEAVHQRAGGAGLAATLLARDGHDVVLVAARCDDPSAAVLDTLLNDAGVRLLGLPESGTTREKVRLRAGGTSVARWDRGRVGALSVAERDVAQALAGVDVMLCSDYGGPVLAAGGVRSAVAAAGRRVPLVWDPHPRGGPPVAGAAAVTPNLAEALAAAGSPGSGGGILAAAARAADRLVGQWAVRSVVVTLGERGALCSVGAGAPLVVPAPAVAQGDACGAGDRFAAALAAALADGALTSEAVGQAVEAASAFVAAGGASSIGVTAPERDPAAGRSHDPYALVAAVRARGGTVVATGGCFDLLHAGHVDSLQRARALGDCLVVCLNSDDSVRRLKGPGRPLQPQADRARVLAALDVVDAVVVFDEDTPVAVLDRLRPDIWVKGGDYTGCRLPEADVLDRWGGQVVVLPYLTGRSTTGLVTAARASSGAVPTAGGSE